MQQTTAVTEEPREKQRPHLALGPTPAAEPLKRTTKIALRGVAKSFVVGRTGAQGELAVLNGIDLDVGEGEFLALVGPSGCGKSSLLDLIAGLSKPTEGTVTVDGEPVGGPSLERGMVFQGYALFPWRTVRGNIEFGLESKKIPKRERHEIAAHYLSLVGLAGFEDYYPYELSGGMKQRAAIARSLAFDPDVLLMDEPFAAVDAQTRETLQEELLKVWEETRKTIVFITHDIDEAVYLSDRVGIMTARPGSVKALLTSGLPRPRSAGDIRASADFRELRHRAWLLLRDEVLKAQRTPPPSKGKE
jgi:NitT/TauT family transport system ATP-binding protein